MIYQNNVFLAKKIILITLLFVLISAKNLKAAQDNYKYCNSHIFKFAFLKVYNVSLCTNFKENLQPQKIYRDNFSLIINYNLNFDKDELSNSSLEEMRRYYQIDQEKGQHYYNKLMSIFPNVKKGEVIEAKYLKEGIIQFYHNNKLTGNIDDPQFSQKFLNIWLHKDNKYQKMIRDLFI